MAPSALSVLSCWGVKGLSHMYVFMAGASSSGLPQSQALGRERCVCMWACACFVHVGVLMFVSMRGARETMGEERQRRMPG